MFSFYFSDGRLQFVGYIGFTIGIDLEIFGREINCVRILQPGLINGLAAGVIFYRSFAAETKSLNKNKCGD